METYGDTRTGTSAEDCPSNCSKDRYSCLSSKDGSDTTDIFGLKARAHAAILIHAWLDHASKMNAAARSRVSLAFGVVARSKLTVVK